jgi:Uma2 family endonuclease
VEVRAVPVCGTNIRFKADDIWDTPDDGKRWEVIDGALYSSPIPPIAHQFCLGNLLFRLAHHLAAHRLWELVPGPISVVLSAEDAVQPDFVYISYGRAHLITERCVKGAPDLIGEVTSSDTESRDQGIKMRRYAALGVGHYRLLDYQNRALEAHRLGAGGYELVGCFRPGDLFRTQLFPGLAIPIADIFDERDPRPAASRRPSD